MFNFFKKPADVPLGDFTAQQLASIGVTKKWYAEARAKFNLAPECNCQSRQDWLNRVEEWWKANRWYRRLWNRVREFNLRRRLRMLIPRRFKSPPGVGVKSSRELTIKTQQRAAAEQSARRQDAGSQPRRGIYKVHGHKPPQSAKRRSQPDLAEIS